MKPIDLLIPGFDPSILQHNGIWGEADEALLNNVHKKKKSQQFPFKKNLLIIWPFVSADGDHSAPSSVVELFIPDLDPT